MFIRFFVFCVSLLLSTHLYAAPLKIGMLLDDLSSERWQKDRDIFVARASEQGAKVYVKSANGDEGAQKSQIANMIKRKVDVLVIVATNSNGLSEEIANAKAANIKVLAYDRLINNAEIDAYVSFDNVVVGELQAKALLDVKSKGKFFLIGGAETDNNAKLVREGQMNILQPAIDKGNISIAGDGWAEGWSPDNAFALMKDGLKTHKDIVAVVASNDGTAGGAIRALAEQKLAGKVAVSGQDAELSALRRIVKGLQEVTVYKPIEQLANMGADMAVKLAQGEALNTEKSIDNGLKKVGATLLAPTAVTKNNIESTVVADGYQSKSEIFN